MNVDLQNRSPKTERLPDERLRVSRLFDVLNNIPKSPADLIAEVWLAWGTADVDFPNCRLIAQNVSGQDGPFRAPCEEPPQLLRVYEEIPANDRVIVGEPNISFDQYGNKTVMLEFVQFSDGTTTYADDVGTSAAPAPNAACILKTIESTNDGTLIRSKLTYIDSGELSDTQNLRFGGKVVVREITSLGVAPATPSGWSRVTTSVEFTQGRQVYRYGFVNGGGGGGGAGGEISVGIQYNESPDQGTTGVTVTTIKYITALTVTSNPITGPAGSELISVTFEDDTGYRMWTAVYADGQGTVSSQVQTKNGGRLILYSIRAINAPPAEPAPTIGGTVVLVSADTSNGSGGEDGTIIYNYQWAEGEGEISSTVEEKSGGNLILYRITALGTPPDAPAPTIGGSVIAVEQTTRQEDGYVLYNYSWAEGNGEVSNTVETKSGGKLILYRITSLGVAPDAPTPTIGGAVTLIEQTTREEDGYTLFNYQWAEGEGEVSSAIETKNGGELIIYRITSLGTAPATPSPTIGGTVTLIDAVTRQQDGYELFDYQWAEGDGEISRETEYRQSVNTGTDGLTVITIRHLAALSVTANPITTPGGTILISEGSAKQDGYRVWTAAYAKGAGNVRLEVNAREDGSLTYEVTNLGAAAATPSYPGGGTAYLVSLTNDVESGHFVNRAVYIKPPPTVTYRRQVQFQMPGLAYFSGTQLVLQPGADMELLAEVEVSFATSQDTTAIFFVERWGGFIEVYTPVDTGVAINNQFGLNGYLCDANSSSGTGDYKGVDCTEWSYSRFASIPDTPPSGDTVIGVDNVPYLTAIDGTMVFKRTVTTVNL